MSIPTVDTCGIAAKIPFVAQSVLRKETPGVEPTAGITVILFITVYFLFSYNVFLLKPLRSAKI